MSTSNGGNQNHFETLPSIQKRHNHVSLGTIGSGRGLLVPRIPNLLHHPISFEDFKWKRFYGFRISYKHLDVCGMCGRTGNDHPAYLSSWDPPPSNSWKPEVAFSACVRFKSVKLLLFLAQMVEYQQFHRFNLNTQTLSDRSCAPSSNPHPDSWVWKCLFRLLTLLSHNAKARPCASSLKLTKMQNSP